MRRRRHAWMGAALVGACIGALVPVLVNDSASAQVPPNELVSVAPGGSTPIGNGNSFGPSISGDGASVAFTSNPIYGNGGVLDAGLLRNRAARATTLVPPAGANFRTNPAISRDGCNIVFDNFNDVSVQQRCNNDAIVPVITDTSSINATAISDKGRWVAWSVSQQLPAGGFTSNVFVRDMSSGNTVQVPSTQLGLRADLPVLSDEDGNGNATLGFIASTLGAAATSAVVVWNTANFPNVDQSTLQIVSNEPTLDTNDRAAYSDLAIDGTGTTFAYRFTETDCAGSGVSVVGAAQVPCTTANPALHIRSLVHNATPIAVPNDQSVFSDIVFADASTISLSQDGTQLAYSGISGACKGCIGIHVVQFAADFSGVAGEDTIDPVPTAAGAVGALGDPALSSTGRFVAFSASPGSAADPGSGLGNQHVYVRPRLPALSVAPPLDFGDVEVGSTSGALAATITNSGLTAAGNIDGAATGDFQVAGDDCPLLLAPGASCTVSVRFSPAAAGARSGTLTVSEGLDPLLQPQSAATSLRGNGTPPPVVVTTTTTEAPPDTTPPEVTTTTRPPTVSTTSTTGPPAPGDGLTITPGSVTFALTTLGATSDAQSFTVRNTGGQPNTLAAAAVTGVDGQEADFPITADGCAGHTLAAGANCTIGVQFRPTVTGTRAANLVVTGERGTNVTALLGGEGSSNPSLVMSPAVVRGGGVSTAIGLAFPPGATIALFLPGREVPVLVATDATGGFRVPVVIRSGEDPGTVQVVAQGQPGRFDDVRAPLLIVLSTYQPQAASGPAFNNDLDALVSRG